MLKKKYFNGSYPTGFTLIEMLLVITIVALIGIMSFAFLGTGKKENDLKTAQRELAATIKQAQSYALQGKYVSDTVRTPCGFGVHFTDTTHYQIFYIPSGPNPGDDCDTKNADSDTRHYLSSSASPSIETNILKNNVSLQASTADNAEIYFTVPHGNVFRSNGETYLERDIILERPGTATKKTITVSPSGSVLED